MGWGYFWIAKISNKFLGCLIFLFFFFWGGGEQEMLHGSKPTYEEKMRVPHTLEV